MSPEYIAFLLREANRKAHRVALLLALAMLAGCSVSLYSHEWGPPSEAQCDEFPETQEPAECARYVWRGDE